MIPFSFLKPDAVQRKRVVITFDAPPTNVIVNRAQLRFDKELLFCLNQDDGLIGAMYVTLPLFEGGNIVYNGGTDTSTGLFYTDGCGNDYAFTSECNINMYRVTETDTPNTYLSAGNVRELLSKGHYIGNHSYSNLITGDGLPAQEPELSAAIENQVLQNTAEIRGITGWICRQWSAPSGDDAYDEFAESLLPETLRAVVASGFQYTFSYQTYLEEWWEQDGALMWRRDFSLWSDPNILQDGTEWDKFDEEIAQYASDPDRTAVVALGTHRVDYGDTETGNNTSQRYVTLKYLMQGFESRYGKSGADNALVVPQMKAQEYLDCKDNAIINQTIDGNDLILDFNFSGCYWDALEHAMTLLIGADQNITNVAYEGFQTTSDKGAHTGAKDGVSYKGMINVAYEPPWTYAVMLRLRATVSVDKFEIQKTQALRDYAQLQVDKLPTGDALALRTLLQTRIDAVTVLPDSETIYIDFGKQAFRNSPSPYNNFDGALAAGVKVGAVLTNLINSVGAATGIDCSVSQDFDQTEDNSAASDSHVNNPYPYSALRDSWETFPNSSTPGAVKFSNLDPTKLYDFTFCSSRGSVDDHTHYTAIGTNTETTFHLTKNNGQNDLYETGQILNIQPDVNNEIEIEVRGANSSGTPIDDDGYLGVIEITKHG